MPLIVPDSPQPKRAPWRGVVVGLAAAALFVVTLAFLARAMRDDGPAVPEQLRLTSLSPNDAAVPREDASTAVTDAENDGAGSHHTDETSDAGAFGFEDNAASSVTVPAQPDAGPIGAAGPPVDVNAVVGRVIPILERCLHDALRFDPALGGRGRLRIEVRAGALTATLVDATSPVLAACVTERVSASVQAQQATGPETSALDDVIQLEARVLLDGLRGQVRVESAAVLPDR